jgi:hypothetical protein
MTFRSSAVIPPECELAEVVVIVAMAERSPPASKKMNSRTALSADKMRAFANN